IAFGPAGEVYVTRQLTDPARLVLDRLDPATGGIVWESKVGREYGGGSTGDSPPVIASGSPLRLGPDGTLYYLVQMGRPGDEWGWMPVATPAGTPLSPGAQIAGIHWPYQPLHGGLRRGVFCDTLLPDLRVGADGKLYQLSTSPDTGITVTRFPLG